MRRYSPKDEKEIFTSPNMIPFDSSMSINLWFCSTANLMIFIDFSNDRGNSMYSVYLVAI